VAQGALRKNARAGCIHVGGHGVEAHAVQIKPLNRLCTPSFNFQEIHDMNPLADPEALVPGQRMGYSLQDASVRADVVAYLATLKPAR
jgi:hypothetical protein